MRNKKVQLASITILFGAFFCVQTFAAKGKKNLSFELEGIRKRILVIEDEILQSSRSKKSAGSKIKRIRTLLKLQKKEWKLGKARLAELQKYIKELERRKVYLKKQISNKQKKMRTSLSQLHTGLIKNPKSIDYFIQKETIEAPRRRALIGIVDQNISEITALEIDLADAAQLEAKIEEEKQELSYLFQNLKEQESLLAFHKKFQIDLLRKKHDQRIIQLQNYRRLKRAELQVTKLIDQFNARLEFEKINEMNRKTAALMLKGSFLEKKGLLDMPVSGKIVSSFGRNFDKKSKLKVFKKGIDIAADKNQSVKAVFSGRVVYSGRLPRYGNVTILDHGANYYSLVAQLGKLGRKVGEFVKKGEALGSSDSRGTPVYFEIRAKNVPVNPVDWFKKK